MSTVCITASSPVSLAFVLLMYLLFHQWSSSLPFSKPECLLHIVSAQFFYFKTYLRSGKVFNKVKRIFLPLCLNKC